MPITISYDNFITQTGSMSTQVSTPGSFSPIASNITDLDASDRTITFTNLPNGLKVALTQDTPTPFDSIYVDLNGYDDYILMSGNDNNWEATVGQSLGSTAKYMPDAGFWGLGGFLTPPGLSCTGIGGSGDSILDITFETINFQETTYTANDADPFSLILERGRKYILDAVSYGSFTDPIIFNQDSNYDWYPVEIVTSGSVSDTVVISGTSHSGNGASTTLTFPFSGIVKWMDNGASMILEQDSFNNLYSFAPGNFNSFATEGSITWNATYANENFSTYNILANNAGNTGQAVIQLTNPENFNNLIPPLRKLYVTFTDNP